MDSLKDKVAIVTGASSGIGRATAIALSHAGAKVVLAARRQERLEDLEKVIEGEHLSVVTDVSNEQDVQDLAQKTIETFGRIDILINNAGVMLLSNIDSHKVKEWEQMIDVNIKGVLYGVSAVLPQMKAQESGHIINIASTAGHRVFPSSSVYSGTKYAVRAISEGLRQEISPNQGIRVSIVSPGVVDTELSHHISDEAIKEKMSPGTFVEEALNPEDIANAIVYAVSQPQHVNVNEILVRPTDQPS